PEAWLSVLASAPESRRRRKSAASRGSAGSDRIVPRKAAFGSRILCPLRSERGVAHRAVDEQGAGHACSRVLLGKGRSDSAPNAGFSAPVTCMPVGGGCCPG